MNCVSTRPPLVTIIIPLYNRNKSVAACLQSVWAQTHRPLEVVLVDDGSTDDTARAAEAWTASRASDPSVVWRVIRLPTNRGPSAARNTGLDAARGDFINFLDSDDRLLPDKITIQIKSLRRAPAASCAYAVTRYADENGGVREWMGQPPPADIALDAVTPAFGCIAPLWTREALRRAGPWDETLSGREDWEYRARVLLAHGPGVFVNQVLAEKCLHGGVRESAHGTPDFARRVWACAEAVRRLLENDPRTTPAARTALAAGMSGVFRTLLRARCDAEAGDVLRTMAALADGPRGRRYRAWRAVWRVGGAFPLRLAGRLTGRLG